MDEIKITRRGLLKAAVAAFFVGPQVLTEAVAAKTCATAHIAYDFETTGLLFDDNVIMAPLLYGELFPLVSVVAKPVKSLEDRFREGKRVGSLILGKIEE